MSTVWGPWSARWHQVDKGRSFYKRLFDLRSRLEREREMTECLWGFGRLRWAPGQEDEGTTEVDHPLLTVPIEVSLDQRTGRITLGPAGAPQVENGWSIGLELADRAGFNEQRLSAEQLEVDPWGPSATELMVSLLRQVDIDGTHTLDDKSGHDLSHAHLATGRWVVFVRRRQPNLIGFIEDQRQLYKGTEAIVPPAFAALVIDEPSKLGSSAVAALGTDDLGMPPPPTPEMAQRILLPLPTNDEQMRIVELARTMAGVTAQGPPGTGKSHTIANLISHYVAHGQRVLVTAEKEQALKVLIDKVPEDIRQLCVPVLGADHAARARLLATVVAIADAAHRAPELATIARLERELDDLGARFAATTNTLKQRRAAETGTAPNAPATYSPADWTPSKAAAWVSSNAALAGIPDSLGTHQAMPISGRELEELYSLCQSISREDADEALRYLPDPATLPSGSMLATLDMELSQLRQALGDIEADVASWDDVDRAGSQALGDLANDLRQWADWLARHQGTWVAAVLSDAGDPQLASIWQDFCRGASEERESVLANTRALAADTVEIAVAGNDDVPGPELVEALTDARQRLASGKGVGAFQRGARRALDACKVNGRTPANDAEVELVLAEISRRTLRRRLATRWDNLRSRTSAPELPGKRPVEAEIGERVGTVREALEWRSKTWPSLASRLRSAGVAVPGTAPSEELARLSECCRTLARRERMLQVQGQLERLASELALGQASPGSSPLWQLLSRSLQASAYNRWDELKAEAVRLNALAAGAGRRRSLLMALQEGAPMLAADVAAGNQPVPATDFERAWRWKQVETWLRHLADGPEPSVLQAQLERLTKDIRRVTTDLVTAKAWAALAESIDDRRRTALNRFTTANARLGKGTGRYAAVWEAEVRAAMNDAKDAVPVWIMPINKVLSSFRPSPEPPFDVIIVDEASQVNMLSTPVLALAARAIVVGDDKQTSPENVGVLRQTSLDLLDEHLGAISDRRTRFNPDNSLYDLARQQFPQVVQLREHFRCLPRIIEFSNRKWYNGSIIPLRDRPPAPGWPPLGSVFVASGTRRRSDDANQAEAEAVVDLIAELVADPSYDGMTFGVVTLLGTGQGPLVNNLLLDRLGPVVMEERKLRVGDPATFQGDERDVVVVSLVAAHDPDRRGGAMTTAASERRVNVAASRASNQLWVVHSVGPDSLHVDDPRRALLEHCLSGADEGELAANMDKTESQFERDVLSHILSAGYTKVQTQYAVGGYRIDIVVEGPERRLAVECDGDYWHGPEAWDRDRARQMVLERAGWTFERIRGSAFYHDQRKALEPLWHRLDELGIPKGDWAVTARPRPTKRRWPEDFPERLANSTSLYEQWGARSTGNGNQN
ncbi:MAG: AAA domain-containing protein [Actinobacteria bacterium]|nr:AAA domain-containing protein [Actinomycetota bacterium]